MEAPFRQQQSAEGSVPLLGAVVADCALAFASGPSVARVGAALLVAVAVSLAVLYALASRQRRAAEEEGHLLCPAGGRGEADPRKRSPWPQAADLRPWRPDRLVRGDQADRPGRPQPDPGLTPLGKRGN